MIMKPDASKQHELVDILSYREAIAHGDGPYCWNCELGFESLENAPADLPLYFCSPLCKQDWVTRQPLQNLLDKRRTKQERSKMTDNDKFQQGRVAWLTNGILAVLAGADSAEASTALILAVIASAHWRTSDATARLQVVDGFAQQVRELAQCEDTIKRIEASITWALQVERS